MDGRMRLHRRWFVVPVFVLVAGFAVLWEQLLGPPDRNSARAYWQRYVEAHPEFAMGYSRLGLACEGVRDWQGAERAYKMALALDPSVEEVMIGLSGVVRRTRGHPAAVALLSSFLAEYPGCGVCSYNLASDHLVQGELRPAREQIDLALANLDSTRTRTYGGGDLRFEALVLAGQIYTAAGQPEAALAFLEDAIARKSNNAEAQLAIGRLRMREDPAATASHWRRYRKLAPEDVRGPLFEARAELAAARYAAALRALDVAEDKVDASPAAARWKYEIAFDRARVAFQRHDLEDARRGIRELIRSSSEPEKIERAERFLARIDASPATLPDAIPNDGPAGKQKAAPAVLQRN